MPNLDMPLEELKTYLGTSPIPENIVQFWENAVDKMRETPVEFTFEHAEFQASFADCFNLSFNGGDGVKLYAKYLRPKNITDPCPLVLYFHGYSGCSGNWTEYLPYAANGFCVAALDCRGQAGLSHDKLDVEGQTLMGFITRGLINGPENLYYYSAFLDTVRLADLVSSFDEIDHESIGTAGNSQGGALAIACAALVPKVKAVASVYPFLSDYQRAWELDLTGRAYNDLNYFFRKFDPLHKNSARWFHTLGYIDVKNLASLIRGKVLMGLTLKDETCPPSTQFAVYNRIESPKESMIYYDYGHEPLIGMNDAIFRFFDKALVEN